MADLTLFGYRHGHTLCHGIDPRVKLAGLLATSIGSLLAGPLPMVAATVFVVSILWLSHIHFTHFVREVRYFMLLLSCVAITRGLTTPGEPFLTFYIISLSRDGLYAGGMLFWRLFLIVALSLGLTATTRTVQIRWAIEWYLRFIPWLPNRKIGTMIGLLVRFMPEILNQSRNVTDAQRARAIDQRKNPIYRMVHHCMPLLRHTFITADRLALAMEARGYGEDSTPPSWQLTIKDLVAFAMTAILFVLMITL
jgi:energy-coupling factor transporter transmembrane protein EcfT